MKKLKFLILAFGLLAAQWVLAVQLPSTSYNANESDVTAGGVYSFGPGIMVKGSFHSLGTYENCRAGGGENNCSTCCYDNYYNFWVEECGGDDDIDCIQSKNQACVNECEGDDDTPLGPPDSPIDGGLWILLTLALLSGACAVVRNRVKHIAVNS